MPRYEEIVELVNKVKKAVCEKYGCDPEVMNARSGKKRCNVEPRHIAMYLCRKHLEIGYQKISEEFGLSDHVSAMHAHNTISSLSDVDNRISRTIIKIESTLLPDLFSHKRIVYYTFFDGRVCHGLYKDEQSVVKQPIGKAIPIIIHR